jgi:hypothetical protein
MVKDEDCLRVGYRWRVLNPVSGLECEEMVATEAETMQFTNCTEANGYV